MRIGIDIDGVLTDIEQWQLDVGGKYFSAKGKKVQNPNGYEISEIFDVDEKEDSLFWDAYLYDYIMKEPARKYAADVIHQLRREGNEIYIITARVHTTQHDDQGDEARTIVKQWLCKYQIEYDSIVFSPEEKLENCKKYHIDVMIEDKVDNINKISIELPVICFHASYNQKCQGKNIYCAYTWYDVYLYLQEIRQKKY